MNAPVPPRLPRLARRPPTALLLAGLLVVFHLMLSFAGPERLPLLIQRLTALADAGLAMGLVMALLAGPSPRAKKWSLLGRPFNLGPLAGLCVFALVFAWWLSPLAPIGVDEPVAQPLDRSP